MNDKAEEVKAEVVGSEERPGPMAIVALICGILSMLCCWVPFFGFILITRKSGQSSTHFSAWVNG